MFTGIIEAIGCIELSEPRHDGLDLEITAPWRDIQLGESIAVDGVCLTVAGITPDGFQAQVVATSLDRTVLGVRTPGDRVNLERALRVGDRLGGHLVQGHVDGIGSIRAICEDRDAAILDIVVPSNVADIVVPQGSLAVDGVSLTILAIPRLEVVQVALVPFTRAHTTLGERQAGDHVNLEADVVGKYLRSMAAPWLGTPKEWNGTAHN